MSRGTAGVAAMGNFPAELLLPRTRSASDWNALRCADQRETISDRREMTHSSNMSVGDR